MKAKRLSALLLVLAMAIYAPTAVAARDTRDTPFADMPSDWSAEGLTRAVENGLLQGENGLLRPDDALTRAELAAVIARAFGTAGGEELSSYFDVKPSEWYAGAAAGVYRMGVLQGYDGKMMPHETVSRQEVFVTLARAFRLRSADTLQVSLQDGGEISDWCRGEVYALVNAGFAQGSGGRLRPLERMTRAELARLMDNLLRQYLRVPGVVTQVVPGGVMVNVPGVTLRDLTVNGDLIVGDGVGDGACVLENVTVAGRLVVRGGGEDGIILRGGSSVAEVVMSRVGGTVSVKVERGAVAGGIRIDECSADVNLYGSVDTVAVEASRIRVKTLCAKIGRIDVIGGNTGISVDAESVVGEVTVQGAAANTLLSVAGAVAGVTTAAPGTTVEGLGKVAWVEVRCGADNARVETSGTQIQTAAR